MSGTLSNRERRIRNVVDAYLGLLDKLATVIWGVALLLCGALVLVVSIQVFARYVLQSTPAWGGELSRYLAIWFTLLMAGVLVRTDEHLQVELVFQRLPYKVQIAVRSVQLLMIAAVGFIVFNWGWIYALDSGFRSTAPAMGFPMFYMYMVFPISGLLILLFSVGKLAEILTYPETLKEDYESRFEIAEEDER